jgi:hypothetical protein
MASIIEILGRRKAQARARARDDGNDKKDS